MDAFTNLDSRKLKGLVITIMALVLVFGVYLVASVFVNVSEVVVTAITSAITALGGGHQAAQAAADRSQYYQSPTQFVTGSPTAAPPWTAPPADSTGARA
jgi:hypothetical protein